MEAKTSTPVHDELQDESLMSMGYPSPTTQYKEVIKHPPVSLLDLPDEDNHANVSKEEIIIEEHEVTNDDAQ